MLLIEVRDLDGPNLFLVEPAIKVELAEPDERGLLAAATRLADAPAGTPFERFAASAETAVAQFSAAAGQPVGQFHARRLDTPGHIAIAFGWTHRRAAIAVGESVAAVAIGDRSRDEALAELERRRDEFLATEPDDLPRMVRDIERTVPVVAITGTNGKTTTTRLLAHIAMQAGKRAGWSSSSGVYIDGREVLTGDYSGPAGARRVLAEQGLDVAILETARGGILLRGIACESNDVSVFTNISADHLDLHGIRTVESLAEVKAVVCEVTKPDGTVVVNAGVPLVLAATANVRAPRLLFGWDLDAPPVREHLVAGGRAIVVEGGALVLMDAGEAAPIVPVEQMPVGFGGRARHMIENAMAAAGAAVGLGFPIDTIASGLRSFRNSADLNLGRLNVFDLGGVTVVLDFAHNEAGLAFLLEFARQWTGPGGRIISIIGTAGDRTSDSLRELGRIAATRSDRVIIKETAKYVRGRTNAEMNAIYEEGVQAAGLPGAEVAPSELAAYDLALAGARPGDVIAIMCQEYISELRDRLVATGRPLS